jgi:hypothetical protein
MPRPDHLIFLHVQKTAGTTLHNVISRHYRRSEMITFYNVPMALKFTQLPPEKRNQYKVLKGHQPYGFHTQFSTGETEYITLLREPVDRVVSHFYHLGSDEKHPFHSEFHREKYSIIQLLESGKILNLNNCMVRLYSGEYNRAYDACDEAMLEKALQNLESMALVGLQHEFDVFLLQAALRYNWSFPYYSKRRVSKSRVSTHTLDKPTQASIEHYNKLDIELYRIMKPRIEAFQAGLGDAFYSKLDQFKRRNAVAGKFLNVYYNLRRAQ